MHVHDVWRLSPERHPVEVYCVASIAVVLRDSVPGGGANGWRCTNTGVSYALRMTRALRGTYLGPVMQ